MDNFIDWITTKEAAERTGYNIEYIRRLIRSGKVDCKKFGRDWMVSLASLKLHKATTKPRGKKPKEVLT